MPQYKFTGTAMVRYGGQRVYPGDIIDASGIPGANYEEVKPAFASPKPKSKKTTSPTLSGATAGVTDNG